MEARQIFDTIPELFDRYRPRYTPELFTELIEYTALGPGKTVLELGPGTGQATDPILDTGCQYLAVELGEHLTEMMQRKYGRRPNFSIVNDDFITHDFGERRFDLICSASAIQWIPEEIAFTKTFSLLKPGGTLAMMLTKTDYKTPDPKLYGKIQEAYDRYFKPAAPYIHGSFPYADAPRYGYTGFEKREYHSRRVLTADEYIGLCGTHSDHITIPEPWKTKLFEGLRAAVMEAGGRIVMEDTHILYLAGKP